MTSSREAYLIQERIRSQTEIQRTTSDFTAAFFAVCHLHRLAEEAVHLIAPETVDAVRALIESPRFADQRQSIFLFREAAGILTATVLNAGDRALAALALDALTAILRTTDSHAHRAAAEALGDLPISLRAPEPPSVPVSRIPALTWHRFLETSGHPVSGRPRFKGRSLVVPLQRDSRVLVCKMARPGDRPESLIREACWMERLSGLGDTFPVRFDIPRVIFFDGSPVFRLTRLPENLPERPELHPAGYAAAFLATPDYFVYPNESDWIASNRPSAFKEVIFRNAWLLGRLAGLGLVHDAPIPLFHNRVQTDRRRDGGMYEWFRAGRLDRWLASCTFPNLGPTGIRDFEHLLSFSGPSRKLYRHIGTHFLSLLLVTGSYFRNAPGERAGLDDSGRPIDARDLFDRDLLVELILGIFNHYYDGFSGTRFTGRLPLDLDRLADRMIEEMGVDRHMEEILRRVDQDRMTVKEFFSFLKARGYSDPKRSGIVKGKEDLVLQTGPHLGAFNDTISIPELIQATETFAGLCIAGRFCHERWRPASERLERMEWCRVA